MKRLSWYALILFMWTCTVASADITTGLVGLWTFNESSGTTAIDSSGNGNNGTYVGSPTHPAGYIGTNAVGLNGSSQYVNVPTAVNGSTTGTISAWFKGTVDSCQILFAIGTGVGDSNIEYVAIGDGCSGALQSELITVSAATSGSGSWAVGYTTGMRSLLFDGSWHHIAVVFSGGSTTAPIIYLDGTPKTGTITDPSPPNYNYGFPSATFASWGVQQLQSGNFTFLNGSLDHARLYTRALSASDVIELFHEGNPGQTCDLRVTGTTITACTCSQEDTQRTLDAGQAGDTLVLPAGTCHWSYPINWMAPADVIFKGAGTTARGGSDQTVIIDDITLGNNQFVLGISTSITGTFRLSGITFQGGTGELKDSGFLLLGGQSKQFRVDHMHFNTKTYTIGDVYGKQVYIDGWQYGVLDQNKFEMRSGPVNAVAVNYPLYNGDTGGWGDASWTDSAHFGSEKFVYIEDNTFTSPSTGPSSTSGDCIFGGRQAFRFNDFGPGSIGTQSHGAQSNRRRGCRAWEFYANSVIGSDAFYTQAVLYHETGSVITWGNYAPIGYSNFIKIQYDRSTTPYASVPNAFGNCGTLLTGTGANWDGNTDVPTGYPCMDQMGRGAGDLLSLSFPNVVNTATGCIYNQTCAYPRQVVEPSYEWLNTWTATPSNPGDFWSLHDANVPVVANRDYYLYTPSFTGATGVGSGTLASRPGTCTPLTAYWATDQGSWNAGTNSFYTGQGVLYTCTATNTWTASYTPYTYPHPLVTGSQAPTTPTILRLVR